MPGKKSEGKEKKEIMRDLRTCDWKLGAFDPSARSARKRNTSEDNDERRAMSQTSTELLRFSSTATIRLCDFCKS
jgi:hypothetical protein